jgi:hypothetical protein
LRGQGHFALNANLADIASIIAMNVGAGLPQMAMLMWLHRTTANGTG